MNGIYLSRKVTSVKYEYFEDSQPSVSFRIVNIEYLRATLIIVTTYL